MTIEMEISNPKAKLLYFYFQSGHNMILVLSLLLACCSQLVVSHSAVKYLPGFQGPLPFEFETGWDDSSLTLYVGVDESEEVQLFYYFVKSESNPQEDPLVASIIFVDLPVGTGFSYARTSLASHSTDLQACDQAYQFLSKWLMDHPEFHSNQVYVGGDSYSGITVPVIVQLISNGNEAGIKPFIHLMCTNGINNAHVLEPSCGFASPKPYWELFVVSNVTFRLKVGFSSITLQELIDEQIDGYRLSHSWLNNDSVQEALHIQKAWIRTLNYSIVDDWRPWVVEGQDAGYTRTYSNGMTCATVKA
ncbi:hypothetical protein RHMOL_Rhmol07G0282800 [Rhododendron molle]|uniref:Uncharacterized protein n=1 Tax=Rhododendron molle TaxID=49168 RepID=A0ACC0N5M3_RHOML|nr:hypothetical protein RHMOL_Rhmol07G0282800 [Rhododendron molle]